MAPRIVEFMEAAKKQQQRKIIRENSHAVAKLKAPKIRIIHIFAPEIIKIDPENFRETVQKLTGKPSNSSSTPKRNSAPVVSSKGKLKKNSASTLLSREENHQLMVKKESVDHHGSVLSLWENNNNNNNSISSSSTGLFFKEIDGFLQGYNEFTFQNSSHLD